MNARSPARRSLPTRVGDAFTRHPWRTAGGVVAVLGVTLGLGALSDTGDSVTAQAPATVATTAARPTTTTERVTTTERATTTTTRPTTTVAPTTLPPTTAAPTTPAPTAPPTTATPVVVSYVVDGDTVDLSSGERIRMIGVDAPEVGECGYERVADRLSELVLGKPVSAPAGARDDIDRYGRFLRYIDVAGIDAGVQLINEGLAIARYDSRDGYGAHTRQSAYVTADALSGNANVCAPPVTAAAQPPSGGGDGGGGSAYYRNCDAVRAAGKAPLYAGEPGYSTKLDRDRDGVACE